MVAPVEVTVDGKGMPLPSIDPNVPLPPSVARQAKIAEQLHQTAYNTQPDSPPPLPSAPPQPAPPVSPASPQPDPRASWDASQWMQHAKSMEGRFNQARDTIGSLQSTMTEMGDELLRLQTRPAPMVQPLPSTVTSTPTFLTPEDVEQYGEPLIETIQRAARQAVTPELTRLEQRNQDLESRLRRSNNQTIVSALSETVPNWSEINTSDRFKNWLRLRDVYSGRVRGDLLKEAHRAADAARVLSFFRGFLAEEAAIGSTEFVSGNEPPPNAAPHEPTLSLQALASPGHPKPAQGAHAEPADGPQWITRAQIAQFYDKVRRGGYVGRDQDYHNDQAFIFECQRAGRVR